MIGTYLENARMLGERTAAMHRALASETQDRNFSPEPLTPHAQRGLFQSMRNLTRQNFQLLAQRLKHLPPEAQSRAQQVLETRTGNASNSFAQSTNGGWTRFAPVITGITISARSLHRQGLFDH